MSVGGVGDHPVDEPSPPPAADPISLMDAAAHLKAALRTATAPRWIVEDIEAAMARTPGLSLPVLVEKVRNRANEFAGQPARTCIETLWPTRAAERQRPSGKQRIEEAMEEVNRVIDAKEAKDRAKGGNHGP